MDEEDIVYGPYTLPEISVIESEQSEKNILSGLLQNITNIAIAENAERSLFEGDIIGRPSIRMPGVQKYDNTCFQYGKNVCIDSGYTNIPDSVYDNRTFAQNFQTYGFTEVGEGNMLPGDFIQYVDPNRRSSNFPQGYPYHFGVVQSDSTYTMSGGAANYGQIGGVEIENPLSGDPVTAKNIYYNEDRTTKDPFRVYRLTDPKPNLLAEIK